MNPSIIKFTSHRPKGNYRYSLFMHTNNNQSQQIISKDYTCLLERPLEQK